MRGPRTGRDAGRLSVSQVRTAAILAGGAAGALTRAALEETFPQHGADWPWVTFAVNVAGAALLGWLTTRLAEMVPPTRYWRALLGTGFCGALTTFSTLQVEAIRLARDGSVALAAAYVAASIGAGMLAAVAATVIARRRRYG